MLHKIQDKMYITIENSQRIPKELSSLAAGNMRRMMWIRMLKEEFDGREASGGFGEELRKGSFRKRGNF